ncbi:Uncharacterized protein containing a TIR (Toll-Interleukin 1-resistance) domain protein [Methanolacinia petrolearia DSM 11571]|uniref:Uncharacterized protein containing a TIR (Toll-Interleukin 1-resistance) domain protein n=1 Tax=Methanolacinia petrolearia (strain DSM 11571 / OCM 486 / SEBR 4847) TaxID=679926 RepID=E1RH94_METP4|nr:TIR domain-containing protein [Methanolacinia petrolearia]ADN36398.1 Uncharacterized protein containing a TIR (Toll-Interleukin 1-resistance) domain protein [Methanolacinia petrolearia DSM 11571]
MYIDPNWSFLEAVEAAYAFYRGNGVMARGRQFNALRNWGNVVGKKSAINEMESFIRECGTKKGAAEKLEISVSTLRRLEIFYGALPEKKYDVALSFSGNERDYVKIVADSLIKNKINVFYDEYEEVNMWGKNLIIHLEEIFSNEASCVVIFASKNYVEKAYPCLEKDAALVTAINSKKEYILIGKFDETQIPGIPPSIKYIDLKKISAEQFADLIYQKLKYLRVI